MPLILLKSIFSSSFGFLCYSSPTFFSSSSYGPFYHLSATPLMTSHFAFALLPIPFPSCFSWLQPSSLRNILGIKLPELSSLLTILSIDQDMLSCSREQSTYATDHHLASDYSASMQYLLPYQCCVDTC